MSRRAFAAPVLLAVMFLAGCGGAGDDAPDAAAPATPIMTAPSAIPTATFQPASGGKKAKPTVAPEVIVPSTTDATSQRALAGNWEGRVVAALTQVDPRLVADQAGAVK
jgi:hypothetical protein